MKLSDASASQRNVASLIALELATAGCGWLVVPAVANAYGESQLDPRCVFELDPARANGWNLLEPRDNIRRCLEVMHTDGRTVLTGRGRTNRELGELFGEWVLRRSDVECARRADLVDELFGLTVARRIP